MARTFFLKLLTYLSSEDELDVVLNDEADGQSSRHSANRQRRKFIRRDHIQGHESLFRDYFAKNPVYPSNLFRMRFRMSRPLFLRILNEVESYEPYFIQRRDNAGILCLSSMQKITVALRMLAYGVTGDFMDEHIRLGESTAMESLKKFSETIECWEALTACIGSGKFVLQLGKIWHVFFGMPDSHNDINVLEKSSIFTELAQGRAPPINYTINGNHYEMGYYLADGIYPKW
ncbi:hypothetical protein F2P56_002019 [Juglans regia]|uniref:Uncharacterized protein LOC108996703 n=2 Tax=Juglans regia TaxID=51240 RepID=A0A2I4F9E5_JUGRE|nr:uncharacterized protein LOC108996703 [Juglans regia]KAF5481362.1 hypothetical protein F2P56_002019 [Juglans regia]